MLTDAINVSLKKAGRPTSVETGAMMFAPSKPSSNHMQEALVPEYCGRMLSDLRLERSVKVVRLD
jgi:hypothetical protein